ncbi:MAG: HAD hydrolase-like protein, partial [Brevundimonas sp.]|uniref:HAD family hydrolase n=1 Tax=Brevundimonas sp. TaxID=1871086 RepID=UPI002732D0AE
LVDAGARAEAAVMIGDTSFDMAMGVAAAVRPIGVDWGYHDAEELHAAGAASVAFSMDELYDQIVETT